MFRSKKLLIVLGVLTINFLCLQGAAYSQAVTRAYKTDTPLQRGLIVRLSEGDDTKVVPLKYADITKMEGVVVAANDAPVTLSDGGATTQQVFVATTGRYNVLVSNQSGAIKKDEYITISALDGIGMKAGGDQSRVIGKALAAFDGKSNVSSTTKVKNSAGVEVSIAIGLVPVDISISRNPLEAKKDNAVPGIEYLQKVAGDIADKPVAPVQLYIALLALLVSGGIAGSILYAGVRTSLTAIGRNPLAKSSVMRNLLQVVITSLIILIIGVTAVYLILKL